MRNTFRKKYGNMAGFCSATNIAHCNLSSSSLPFPSPFSKWYEMICTKMNRIIKCSICCFETLVLGYLIETIDFIIFPVYGRLMNYMGVTCSIFVS